MIKGYCRVTNHISQVWRTDSEKIPDGDYVLVKADTIATLTAERDTLRAALRPLVNIVADVELFKIIAWNYPNVSNAIKAAAALGDVAQEGDDDMPKV